MLAAYYFVIKLREVSENNAHWPSTRPNYKMCYKKPVAQLLAPVSVLLSDDLITAIVAVQTMKPLTVHVLLMFVEWPMIDARITDTEESHWKVVTGVLTDIGRIY
jgi:hypothetical protein